MYCVLDSLHLSSNERILSTHKAHCALLEQYISTLFVLHMCLGALFMMWIRKAVAFTETISISPFFVSAVFSTYSTAKISSTRTRFSENKNTQIQYHTYTRIITMTLGLSFLNSTLLTCYFTPWEKWKCTFYILNYSN